MTITRAMQDAQRRVELEKQNVEVVRAHNVIRIEHSGRFVIQDPIMFGVAFIEKPSLSTVAEEVYWEDDSYPSITAGVREWVRDEKGYYIGARIWVTVT